MTALYSLYDALVSINIPGDKARAVVDAMERDMTSVLATKSDLALLRQELRQELASSSAETKSEFALLRQELASSGASSKSDFALLRQELASSSAQTRSHIQRLEEQMNLKFQLQRSSLITWLGSMLAVGISVLYTLLRMGH
jgi:ferritin-like metal-binding protein YciE